MALAVTSVDDPKLNSGPTLFSPICPFLIAYLIPPTEILCSSNTSGFSFLFLVFVIGTAYKFKLSHITILDLSLFSAVPIAPSLVQNLINFAETISVTIKFHPASSLVFPLPLYALLLDLSSMLRNRILTLLLLLKKAITVHTKLSAVYFQLVLFTACTFSSGIISNSLHSP